MSIRKVFTSNKRVWFGVALVCIAVGVVTSMIVKDRNSSGPAVKEGEYIANNTTTVKGGVDKVVNVGESDTNNDVVTIYDPSIVPALTSVTIQDVYNTSFEAHFGDAIPHMTNYGSTFWYLENGEVWMYVAGGTLRVYKSEWQLNSTTGRHELVRDTLKATFTTGIGQVYNVMSVGTTNTVLVACDWNVNELRWPTQVKVITNYAVSRDISRTYKLMRDELFGRGIRFGDVMRMGGSDDLIYILGEEYSPETKHGIIYVYDVVDFDLVRMIVDPKLVSLLVAGYEYEESVSYNGHSLSFDVSPDGLSLAVGWPNGDIRDTLIALPGSQQHMPKGFFMLFNDQGKAVTNPLDPYMYITRITNKEVATDGRFGKVVRWWTSNYVMVTTNADNIIYTYEVSGQSTPTLVTKLRFAERVVDIKYPHFVLTTSFLYYVDWQRPFTSSSSSSSSSGSTISTGQVVTVNSFGTFVIRDKRAVLKYQSGRAISNASWYEIIGTTTG